jgi:diacylglycerol kinase family enzyme
MKKQLEEIALIVNQDAKRTPAKMKQLHKIANERKLKLRICSGPDVNYEIREALKNKKLKKLIIGGGDGTISSAADLILRYNPKVELCVIPLGTANYYSRSLGHSNNLNHSFNIAFDGKPEKRHICMANSHAFLIGVNIGQTSRMFDEVTDEEKKKFGKFAYFRGIFRVLLKTNPPDLKVKINGQTKTYRGTEMVILNQHIKEPLKFTPEVLGTDPYFEIITYGLGNNKLSPLFAAVVFAVTFGRNQKYLKRIKATKVTIKSSKKLPVAVDGDILESLPLKVELIKTPVTFISG